jgi:hypothetical protein
MPLVVTVVFGAFLLLYVAYLAVYVIVEHIVDDGTKAIQVCKT